MTTEQPVKLNKILYKAHYRGTKETSHIVTLFIKHYLKNRYDSLSEHNMNQLMEFVDTDDVLLFTGDYDQNANPLRKQFCKFLVDIQWFKDNLP